MKTPTGQTPTLVHLKCIFPSQMGKEMFIVCHLFCKGSVHHALMRQYFFASNMANQRHFNLSNLHFLILCEYEKFTSENAFRCSSIDLRPNHGHLRRLPYCMLKWQRNIEIIIVENYVTFTNKNKNLIEFTIRCNTQVNNEQEIWTLIVLSNLFFFELQVFRLL